MTQKTATPSKAQQEIIRRAGLDPQDYVVMRELMYSIIVRCRDTGKIEILSK